MTHRITWSESKRKLSELLPWPHNPRQIRSSQAERLLESVEQFGQVETLAIDPDGEILNGHQRLKVLMQRYGPDHTVDVRVASRKLTERERQKLTVYLHKGATGEFDFDALANTFDTDDLLAWGFEPAELGLDETPETSVTDAEPQIDRADELRRQWGVEAGQLWQLGEHRLICGDCTDAAVVARLMGGERAQLILTSPPYGVGMEYEKGTDFGDLCGLLEHCFSICCPFVVNDGFAFVNFGERWVFPEPMGAVYHRLFTGLGWRWYAARYWKRSTVGLAVWNTTQPRPMSDMECCWTFQNGSGSYPVHDLSISKESLWLSDGNDDKQPHPAQMHISIAAKALKVHSSANEAALEPFCGTGTTLIACEQLGRKCRAVEISPAYVAVALQRWADATGKTPVLMANAHSVIREE